MQFKEKLAFRQKITLSKNNSISLSKTIILNEIRSFS